MKTDINKYYKIGKVIGSGGFGEVKEVWNKKTGQERAMKIININNMS